MRKRYLPWLIVLGIALAVFFPVAASRGVFNGADEATVYGGLCDAFFVPGIFLACFGLLSLCARAGTFDIFGYGARSLLVLFTPFRKPEKHQRYYDYKLMKELRRGKVKPYTFTIGLLFLALSGICLILYNRVA